MTVTQIRPEVAAKLRGITQATVDEVTADFTRIDWEWLYDVHLGYIAVDIVDGALELGVDPDDGDAVAVFCRLYLKSVAAGVPLQRAAAS